MPSRHFPQNLSQAQADIWNAPGFPAIRPKMDPAIIDEVLDSMPECLCSMQEFADMQNVSKVVARQRVVNMRVLVASVLCVTAKQHLSYGTENGYDISDIAGHYNAMAKERNLPEVSPQAIDYQIKKKEFTVLMRSVFEHLKMRGIAMGLDSPKVTYALELISELTGRKITDLIAVDGCYFTVDKLLARFFPASRTAHKEGSKGVAQIGLQSSLTLKSSMLLSVFLTGGTANEPLYVPKVPNIILLCDSAYSSFAQFIEVDDNGAYQVSIGKKNLRGTVIRHAYVDGKEVKNIKGKAPKDFLRYDEHQMVELDIECTATTKFTIVVDSNGVAKLVPRKINLRAIRIYDPIKGPTWVMTNLPAAVPAEVVLCLMRLRWNIERTFLDLKSHNNLRGARTKSRNLTQTLVWASLATSLLKGITIRCTERLYGRSLSLRRCHKLDQNDIENASWAGIVITLICGCSLPSAAFSDVVHRLGGSKQTGRCKPSSKRARRMLEHHMDTLIFGSPQSLVVT